MDIIKIRFAEDFGDLDAKIEKTIEDMFRSLSPVFSLAERSWKPLMDLNEHPSRSSSWRRWPASTRMT